MPVIILGGIYSAVTAPSHGHRGIGNCGFLCVDRRYGGLARDRTDRPDGDLAQGGDAQRRHHRAGPDPGCGGQPLGHRPPVEYGLIMVVNLALGMITPPFGVNLFAACTVAKI